MRTDKNIIRAELLKAKKRILRIRPADAESFEFDLFAASEIDDALMFLDKIREEVTADGT